MKHTFVLVIALIWAAGSSAVTIDMVTIGNPGNPNDPADGDQSVSGIQHYGAVNYVFNMGKYEVTAGQYTEFLNAVAKADPFELYNPLMTDIARLHGADILQTGSSPNFVYSVAPDWANLPVNLVGLWDAARFANWLHNGQPVGPEGPGTTEDGAYHNVGDISLFGRNPGARFFIPNENEWYKAAYHKNDGATADYWRYPTASNTAPLYTLPDTGNHANMADTSGNIPQFTVGAPYYRTPVGTFINSPSPYGTFDQAGNVIEWIENTANSTSFQLRGGSWPNPSFYTQSSVQAFDEPFDEDAQKGFRIAGAIVPEPSTLVLCLSSGIAMTIRRRTANWQALAGSRGSVSLLPPTDSPHSWKELNRRNQLTQRQVHSHASWPHTERASTGITFTRRVFPTTQVAAFFVTAGSGFRPLPARSMTNDMTETAQCRSEGFTLAEFNATWQETASYRLTPRRFNSCAIRILAEHN